MEEKENGCFDGQTFGRWTSLGITEKRGKHIYVKCRCLCGKEKFVCIEYLNKGKSQSCGCLQKEKAAQICRNRTKHGLRHSRIYKLFYGILNRCYNEKAKDYQNYGGRGIKCKWNSFEDFFNDMNKSYIDHVNKYGEKNTTIDRIDYNGDYCKDNCKWSTILEQNRNKKDVNIFVYKGTKYFGLKSLCDAIGKGEKYFGIKGRLWRKWSLEDAIERPFI